MSDHDERAGEDLLAIITATAEEPVPHLADFVTQRDRADVELMRCTPDGVELVGVVEMKGPVRHAAPSPRSSVMLGRVLLALAIVTVLALAVLLAAELNGGPHLLAVVAASLLITPGAVCLLAALGCAALAAFERWYERGRR